MERELSLLRVTLEALSPLMIASGAEDELHDVLLVRDANGLPTIPATSIAGAIRALVVEEQQGQWFGAETHQIRQRSAVTFTDGLFHWSDNSPRDGLALGSMKRALLDDVLCKLVVDDAEPLLRQHVRLNEYGVVDRTGKFSRTAIPAGARFTFEIRTEIRAAADEIERLLKLGVWLGGATRSGYGQMACVAFGREQFLLPRDWARWTEVATKDIGLESPIKLKPVTPASKGTWVIAGQIEGPLLIGAEGRSLQEDRAPWQETRVIWSGDNAFIHKDFTVIPATAIKGPIRHRTLFHLRRLQVADAEVANDDLFGSASNEEAGAAGKLRFFDALIEDTDEIVQTHVGLDRFTGGARRGVLFTDRMLWRPKLVVRIAETKPDSLTQDQRLALSATFDDLRLGLLGIGAEWGEGSGIFGTIERFSTPEGAENLEAGYAS